MFHHKFVHSEISMHIVSLARTKLVEGSLEQGGDAVWVVDSDVLIPENADILVEHLSDEHPVVSGLYVARFPPHLPQAYTRAAVFQGGYHPYLPVIDVDGPPRFVDAIGAGCLLVRSDVFVRLKEAHDEYIKVLSKRRYSAPETVRAIHYAMSLGPWFEFLGHVGEDFYFCEQLAKIGIRPWFVPEVKCYHIGQTAFGYEHFKSLLDQGLVHSAEFEPGGSPL